LPIIPDNDETPLDELLRNFKIQDRKQGFWPFQLLLRILSRNRILDELSRYKELKSPGQYVDRIRPENDPLPESEEPIYLRIFALLVLCERGDEIGEFVKERVSDQKLPVCRHEGPRKEKFYLCSKDTPGQLLKPFEKWKTSEREWFETTQWQILVPFFELGPDNRAMHYNLDDNAILPWGKKNIHSLISSQPSRSDPSNEGLLISSQKSRPNLTNESSLLSSPTSRSGSLHEGGFADVSCVRIDPLSHRFSDVLKDVSQSL
jgi:hypothetical protein